MYFKVDRKVLKKALVWLKKQPELIKETIYSFSDGKEIEHLIPNPDLKYIEKIEFSLYKTKMDEFYIDYDFAQAIRPALLTKKVIKHD